MDSPGESDIPADFTNRTQNYEFIKFKSTKENNTDNYQSDPDDPLSSIKSSSRLPSSTSDDSTLYDRLQENKEKLAEKLEENQKDFPPKPLDEEDVAFLQEQEQKDKERERRIRSEEEYRLSLFKKAQEEKVIKLDEQSSISRTIHSLIGSRKGSKEDIFNKGTGILGSGKIDLDSVSVVVESKKVKKKSKKRKSLDKNVKSKDEGKSKKKRKLSKEESKENSLFLVSNYESDN